MFVIRVAGAPFDELEHVRTPEACQWAKRVHELQVAKDALAEELLAALRRSDPVDEEGRRNRQRAASAIGNRAGLPSALVAALPELAPYADRDRELLEARERLEESLADELVSVRRALYEATERWIERHVVFKSANALATVRTVLGDREAFVRPEGLTGRQRRHAKGRMQTMLLYLQRVSAKNDTVSEFGPTIWGRVGPGRGVVFAPEPGIAHRTSFPEHWVVQALIDAINRDPEVASDLPLHLHDNAARTPRGVERCDLGSEITLEPAELDLLSRCDGSTPARDVGPPEMVESLCQRGVLERKLRAPMLHLDPASVVLEQLSLWRDTPRRAHWTKIMSACCTTARSVASTESVEERERLLGEVVELVRASGQEPKKSTGRLYEASNAIGECCTRVGTITIGEELVQDLVRDGEGWLDLWCDTYALAASRTAEGLREMLKRVPTRGGQVSLPAFLAAFEDQGLPYQVARRRWSRGALASVRAALIERLGSRLDQPTLELTLEDCHVVRNSFDFERFTAMTWPSLDMQLRAHSAAALAAGDYEWIVSEMHTPATGIPRAIRHRCPEPREWQRIIRSTLEGQSFAFLMRDLPRGHTHPGVIELLDPEIQRVVLSPICGMHLDGWPVVRAADALVVLDEENGDVRLRERGTGRDLGSLARDWAISAGFHPFIPLTRRPGTPRLQMGRVIVQRRTWTIDLAEIELPTNARVAEQLVSIERLRAARDVPRQVFIRPSEEVMGRDMGMQPKDAKAMYVDLESQPFVEIFLSKLRRYKALELTEMLPTPEETVWQEADGKRSFEARFIVVPSTTG